MTLPNYRPCSLATLRICAVILQDRIDTAEHMRTLWKRFPNILPPETRNRYARDWLRARAAREALQAELLARRHATKVILNEMYGRVRVVRS